MTPRKQKAKRFTAALSAAAIALSACSCSKSNYHANIELPTKISFAWWGTDIRSDYTLSAITEYESENPYIEVIPLSSDYVGYKENLDALFYSGKESDVLQINYAWLSEYSPDGEGFYDLNELSDIIGLNNFSEEELSYGTIDGKLNAIPISLNAATFYYNSTLFEKYGLSIPETWDDLFSCAEVFSEDGIYVLETDTVYRWLMLTAHEEQITGKAEFTDSGELNFTEENYISMMEFYKKLVDEKVVRYGESYNKNNYVDGSSAGELLWVSDAQSYVNPLDESGNGKTVVGDYITEKGSKRSGWYLKPTSLYAISKSTDNPEESARLLNFLLNNPKMTTLQGTEKGVPLSRSALETLVANNMLYGTPYEASRQISESSSELSLMPTELENSDRYNAFFEQFDLYYYEQKTVEEAAADYMEALNEL